MSPEEKAEYDNDKALAEYREHQRDEAETLMIAGAITALQTEQICEYLGSYGNAIQERIDRCIQEARDHRSANQHEVAAILSVTAVELVIRFLLLKPILAGSFLSESLSRIVVEKVLKRNSQEDRKLFNDVLMVFGIDLNSIVLPQGKPMWKTFYGEVIPKRNLIIHVGDTANREDSDISIWCAETLLDQVVLPVSRKFGFNWSVTRKWNSSQEGTTFLQRSPFA